MLIMPKVDESVKCYINAKHCFISDLFLLQIVVFAIYSLSPSRLKKENEDGVKKAFPPIIVNPYCSKLLFLQILIRRVHN